MSARGFPKVILAGVLCLAGSRMAPAGESASPQGESDTAQSGREKSGKAQSDAKHAEPSAEDVARRFFIALLTRDEATIKRYSIPSPGSEILWQGAPINDETRSVIKERVADLKFRQLKVGDTVTGPGGKEYKIEPYQVNEGRVLLLPEGFKLPFTLVHGDLGWRVKVDSIVAARQAAAQADEQPEKAGGEP